LKYRHFSDLPLGTEVGLRVGFGGRFGVKLVLYGVVKAACWAAFDNSKRFK
jgi:hypothetical protein